MTTETMPASLIDALEPSRPQRRSVRTEIRKIRRALEKDRLALVEAQPA